MPFYTSILALHLISIITWISSLLYMQKLILLQSKQNNSTLEQETAHTYKYLANPAFLATIVFGSLLLILNKPLLQTGFWIYLKFFFISMIIIVHHLCKIYLNQLRKNELIQSKHFSYLYTNSALILFAFIALLTIIKPF